MKLQVKLLGFVYKNLEQSSGAVSDDGTIFHMIFSTKFLFDPSEECNYFPGNGVDGLSLASRPILIAHFTLREIERICYLQIGC